MKYFQHLFLKHALVGLFLSGFLSGCSTIRKHPGQSKSKTPADKLQTSINKPGQKLHTDGQGQSHPVSAQALNSLYLQLLYTQKAFDTQNYMRSIKPTAKPGSINEAVYILLVLKSPVNQLELQDSDADSEHNQAQSINEPVGNVLAKLESNRFLQTEPVYALTSQFLSASEASPEHWQKFIDLTKSQISKLQTLANSYGENSTNSGQEDTETSEEPYQVTSYSAADLRRGDALLQEARQFAERDEFKKAIQFAKQIDNRDPFYPAAQEQIKLFSNLAVQDLRKKAANAFQRALPVSDIETKIAYLQQAKDFLEQAIKEFPDADQIDTVQENLEVISRDLDNLVEAKEEEK